MGLGESLKKLIQPEHREPEQAPDEGNGTIRVGGTVEPLSDEERARLIEKAQSDLPELDAKVEKNLDRLRELSRS
jgi:hypothetical protein